MDLATIFYYEGLKLAGEKCFDVRFDAQKLPAGAVVVGRMRHNGAMSGSAEEAVEHMLDMPSCNSFQQEHWEAVTEYASAVLWEDGEEPKAPRMPSRRDEEECRRISSENHRILSGLPEDYDSAITMSRSLFEHRGLCNALGVSLDLAAVAKVCDVLGKESPIVEDMEVWLGYTLVHNEPALLFVSIGKKSAVGQMIGLRSRASDHAFHGVDGLMAERSKEALFSQTFGEHRDASEFKTRGVQKFTRARIAAPRDREGRLMRPVDAVNAFLDFIARKGVKTTDGFFEPSAIGPIHLSALQKDGWWKK